jgi:hypothetical protein
MHETEEQKLIRLSQTVIDALDAVIKAREFVETTFEQVRTKSQRAHELSLKNAQEAHGATLNQLLQNEAPAFADLRELATHGRSAEISASVGEQEHAAAWAEVGEARNAYLNAWTDYRRALRGCAEARLAYQNAKTEHDANQGKKSAS